jgi:CHASE3 domain sensor protein
MAEQAQPVTIKLELTIDEVNAILASLGKHPFESIFQLVNKIQQQGSAQVQAAEAAANAATNTVNPAAVN